LVPENLIVKYLSNEASEEEIDALYEWLASDSKNQKVLSEYIKIYDQRFENELAFNTNQGLDLLKSKVESTERKENKVINLTGFYRVAAAVLILLVGLAGYYAYNQLSEVGEVEIIVKSNPLGQKSTFQLPDGSIVKLNAGSSLEFEESFGNERIVKLKGEAFFEVVRDKTRPFKVLSGDVTTTVLGTSFNVNAYQDDVSVAVATGKVQVSDRSGQEVFLTPGEKGVFVDEKLSKQKTDLDKLLAWKDNTLVFYQTSVTQVVADLEKWYGVEIDASEVDAAGCLFNGKFKNENLVNVLEAVSFSTGINYKKENKKVILWGNGCK